MSMLGGLFGGRDQHPNFERVAHALLNHLGFTTAPPSAEVLAILDQLTPRDLLSFDNMHSFQGMEALFRSNSLQAKLDAETSTVTILVASSEEATSESAAEPARAPAPAFHVEVHHAKFHVEPPKSTGGMAKTAASTTASPAESLAPVPEGFEHLEAFEHLAEQVVDMLLRNGRLNSGDKEVLKKIRPLDYTMQGRLASLERWKAELIRRIRGLALPKNVERVILGASQSIDTASEDSLIRRFENLQRWTSKLIQSIEHEGVKFRNKPMWLPH